MNTIKNIALFVLILVASYLCGKYGQQAYHQLTSPPPSYQTNTSHHFENTTNKVVIYTTSWCKYCNKARALLDQAGVAYTNYDIESNNEIINKNYASFNNQGVPKIVIGDHVVNGFFVDEINALLKQQAIL